MCDYIESFPAVRGTVKCICMLVVSCVCLFTFMKEKKSYRKLFVIYYLLKFECFRICGNGKQRNEQEVWITR